MMNGIGKFFVLILLLNIKSVEISALIGENELKLTLTEQNALEQLTSQVSGNITENFMKSDLYLMRWLKKAQLDVKNATTLLLETISWRENHNVSTILHENFSDLEQDYHTSFEGKDKQSRPILEIDLGDWDLRAALVHGEIERLQRHLFYCTEHITQTIVTSQQSGKPVSGFVVLIDASGVNTRQHSCVLCATFLAQWITEVDMFYPDFIHEVIIINAPNTGHIILDLVRVVVPPELNARIRSFDTNKMDWLQYLDSRIDKDQRSFRYGGTALNEKKLGFKHLKSL